MIGLVGATDFFASRFIFSLAVGQGGVMISPIVFVE